MTVENWIELLVPIIGIVVAAVSAGLTYYFAKKQQIAADESRLKEKYYLNYIEAVSNIVVSDNSESARDQLADAQNQLLLIGSAEVVSDLMIFHDYVKPSNSKNFVSEKHDKLLTNLLKSMRKDLYKSKKVNEDYPFSDYQVSVDMSFKSFETMLKRNGFMPAVSVGAFVDKTLVAFILNGVREWDNEKTVYDLGTGVIPDFRRTGIMGELLNLVSAICIKNKIRVYQLEVIQDNEKALTLYKKQGFQVDRVLNCYQLTGGIKEPGIYKAWKLEHPEKIQEAQWTIVKDFWTYPPSWQNAKDAVCAIARSFSYTIVKFDGNLIGYGIVDKIKGDIVQLAVHPQYRRMGVATEILLDLSKQTKSLEMKVINVDERDQALNIFLKKMKFRVFVKQYEMRKYFSV